MLPSDDEGFTTWYEVARPKVVAVLRLTSLDRADLAADAADEAFARAYERWRRVSGMKNPSGWVYVVALDQLRKRQKRFKREEQYSEFGDLRSCQAVLRDTDLLGALKQLSQREREMVALRYLADLTEPEVAATLGVSRGHVAATLHKARQRLNNMVELEGASRNG